MEPIEIFIVGFIVYLIIGSYIHFRLIMIDVFDEDFDKILAISAPLLVLILPIVFIVFILLCFVVVKVTEEVGK